MGNKTNSLCSTSKRDIESQAASQAREEEEETNCSSRVNNNAENEAEEEEEVFSAGKANSQDKQQQQVRSVGEKSERRGNDQEEKSSCDEGLGSSGGSSSASSAQSSTAGSHCDDRETPPHLAVVIEHSNGQSTSPSSPKQQPSTGGACDKLKLCSSPLRLDRQSLGTATESRAAACEPAGGAPEVEREPEKGAEEEAASSSVFFHTNCFNCCTCNELLVDLRALIYVNNSNEHSELAKNFSPSEGKKNGSKIKREAEQERPQDSEYVNLPNGRHEGRPTTPGGRQEAEEANPAQISLYCHRHFVELFKPRCQQCDCLILDEECTEAEGK